jgi:hypothetical protein
MTSSHLSSPETGPRKCQKLNDSVSIIKCSVQQLLTVRHTDMDKTRT